MWNLRYIESQRKRLKNLLAMELKKEPRKKKYRKIPKTSPGAYIFQRPFLRGLFMEGLIFGGAYLWREICVSKSIGQALKLEGNLRFFALFYFVFESNFQVQAPGGLIFGGACFQNFTVSLLN